MKIAALGPEGTFSHEAVLKYKRKPTIVFKNTIWDVFNSVYKKEVDCGIVPIENSLSGSIGFTLDALMDFDLKIFREILIPIVHNLVGTSPLKKIKYLYSHPQAFAQCEKFIRQNLNRVKIIQTASNSDSAQRLSKNRNRQYAAIVPRLAMENYKLKCLAKGIQDSNFNTTRFVVIRSNFAEQTKNDKTSLAIYPHIDKPGLVHGLTGEFAKRKINLLKIESRPSKGKLGDYIIFVEVEGHKEDKIIKDALKAIEKNFFVKILGSYPRKN